MRYSRISTCGAGIAIAALGLLLTTAAPAGAVAPRGQHYAITLTLIDPGTGVIDVSPACLSFGNGVVTTESGDVGTWAFTEKMRRRNSWTLSLVLDNEGTEVVVNGNGLTDRKGPGSSIGATFVATVENIAMNGGLGGVATSRGRCLDFGTSDD